MEYDSRVFSKRAEFSSRVKHVSSADLHRADTQSKRFQSIYFSNDTSVLYFVMCWGRDKVPDLIHTANKGKRGEEKLCI